MNMSPKFLVLSLGLALSVPSFAAPEEVSAFLEGHAILPVNSTVAAPSDAPSDMKISGKYTTGKRIEKGKVEVGQTDGKLAGRIFRNGTGNLEGIAVTVQMEAVDGIEPFLEVEHG